MTRMCQFTGECSKGTQVVVDIAGGPRPIPRPEPVATTTLSCMVSILIAQMRPDDTFGRSWRA